MVDSEKSTVPFENFQCLSVMGTVHFNMCTVHFEISQHVPVMGTVHFENCQCAPVMGMVEFAIGPVQF